MYRPLHALKHRLTYFGLILLVLAAFVALPAGAQRRRAPRQPQQQSANNNQQSATQKPARKNITPLRTGDTPEGSRATITSDVPLNDYSAFRSGDRYYVIIPDASAPAAQKGLRGRGFEDVQVQRRGNDAVLSFKLQPGTTARVNQRFNKLDVEFSTPAAKSAPSPQPVNTNKSETVVNRTQGNQNSNAPSVNPADKNKQTGKQTTTDATKGATQNNQTATLAPGATTPPITTPSASTTASPETGAATQATPAANQTANANTNATEPAATPSVEQIAQSQQPAQPSSAVTQPGTTGNTLGAVLMRNWLWAVIAGLLLITLGLFVATRPRQKSAPPQTASAKSAAIEDLELEQPKAEPLREAPAATVAAAVPVAEAEQEVVTAPPTRAPEAETAFTPAVAETATVEEDETTRVSVRPAKVAAAGLAEPAPLFEEAAPVDLERVTVEIQNVLAGAPYDESMIGARDKESRQLIAAELLAGLAGRNPERQARAREAFVKHGYFDSATRDLRVADAPAERASAARTLGLVRDSSAVPHLVAALDDSEPEVRRAAVESLADLGDSSALPALEALFEREKNRKVPRSLIRRAIDACSVAEEEEATEEAPAIVAETPAPVVAEEEIESVAETQPAVEVPKIVAEAQPVAEVPETFAETALPVKGEAEEVTSEPVSFAETTFEEPQAEIAAAEQPSIAELEEATDASAPEFEFERAVDVAPEFTAAPEFEAFEPSTGETAGGVETQPILAEETAPHITLDTQPLSAEEESVAQAPVAQEEFASKEIAPVFEEALPTSEPALERGIDEWVDVDVTEVEPAEYELTSHAPAPSKFEEQRAATQTQLEQYAPEFVMEREEATAYEPRASEPSAPVAERFETPTAQAEAAREVEIIGENAKGIARFDEELAAVPTGVLRRLSSEDANERVEAVADLARVGGEDAFREISAAFDDPSPEVRNAAARSLYEINTDRAASFTRALREAPPERRRKIGAALASSGLATEAIGQLMGESREKTYDAFSLLFLMSKAGEVQPLMRAIEEHPNNEVRLAVVKLLALSGQQEILPAFRRLAVRGSLPTEVRSAVMEAIYQISSHSDAPSAA